MAYKRILIGGSASTGSSLLKNILARHSQIFSGGETSLFTKPLLYENFNKYKKRILSTFPFALKSGGYHIYAGCDLLSQEYLWDRIDLKNAIDESLDFQDFADMFFNKGINYFDKNFWIEKTPANAFFFSKFLQTFDSSAVIHIYRHPYETIVSMVKRGYSLIYAIGIYLLNTAAALSIRTHVNYYGINYSDLINDPPTELAKLCKFLGISLEDQMLQDSNEYGLIETKISSWKFDEIQHVKSHEGSLWEGLEKDEIIRIKSAANHIVIGESGQRLFNYGIYCITDICNLLPFEIDHVDLTREDRAFFKRHMVMDRLKRSLRNYTTGYQNYPLSIDG